jgi:hypothetical protein
LSVPTSEPISAMFALTAPVISRRASLTPVPAA